MSVERTVMNRKMIAGFMLVGLVVLGIGALSSVSQAGSDERKASSKEMTEAMGNGHPGYGMGGGMMGGGMMGGGMMGGGMMGGGFMGGGSMGGGMMGTMGMTPLSILDLTDQQRAKVNRIQDVLRKKNWNTMGKIMDEKAKLRDLYAADRRDPKKIGTVYGKIFDLKRQMIESGITANNQQEALLTKEQRRQLKQWRRGIFTGAGQPGRSGRGSTPGGMMGSGMMR